MMLAYSSQSRCKPSEYHQGCIPAEVRKRAELTTMPSGPSESFRRKQGAQSWDENWGFMAEFDPKGQPKPDRDMPSRVNMYSEGVPNTNAGNYGARVQTELGKHIHDLEFKFFPGYRKTKLGSDMVCY
ncbi:hypothetical protein LSAT2_020382 [Lamellibrachia satsuma]|nr:hypothetical protein LSAT2_020382 [Lamellibrachia satsuma]